MGGLGGPVGSNMFGEDSPHTYPPTSTHYGHYEPPPQEYPTTSQVQYKEYKTDFKTEPVTPGLGHPGESAYPYPGVPFTPSPSSSGCESPGTPYPSSFYPPSSLDSTERLPVPYNAPSPPLSASLTSKVMLSLSRHPHSATNPDAWVDPFWEWSLHGGSSEQPAE